MSDQVKFLSKSKFAAENGWDPSYVTKLGKQGRLVLDAKKKLVNVAETLALIARSSDPSKSTTRQRHVDDRVQKYVAPHIAYDAPAAAEPPPEAGDPKYWDSRARRESALAEMAEIELAKQRGALVDRAAVESMAFKTGRMFRDVILGLPSRVSPELVAITDAFEFQQRLRKVLEDTLVDLTKMSASDLNRVLEPTKQG